MNEISLEMKLRILNDIVIHKKHLMDSCEKMAGYLIRNGRENLALKLMERSFTHDLSKLYYPEFYTMNAFVTETPTYKSPNADFSADKKVFLDIHWKNNSHHPEHWKDINDMGELDIIEMVCDWHCRSTEYGTDLIEFVTVSQKNRFHLPEGVYNRVLDYCKIIVRL